MICPDCNGEDIDCVRCDGDGELCFDCGEAEGWCTCEDDEEVIDEARDHVTRYITYYTTAPDAYDGFGTVTLDPDAGRDDGGRTIRRVSIDREHLQWQLDRYGSGMHGAATGDEVARFSTIWRLHTREGK